SKVSASSSRPSRATLPSSGRYSSCFHGALHIPGALLPTTTRGSAARSMAWPESGPWHRSCAARFDGSASDGHGEIYPLTLYVTRNKILDDPVVPLQADPGAL